MNKYPLVSMIVINFNGGEVWKDCLRTLEKISYPNWELILIDNGSADGSDHLVEDFKLGLKNYIFIHNEINLGFAYPNNQGFEKSKGKYILLLNNDTKVPPDFLTKMVIRMEKDPGIGAMQPKILLSDMEGYLDNAGTFINKLGLLDHWGFMKEDSKEYNRARNIFSAKGACLLTRRDIIQKIGLFDNDYFAYFEESDFCWRVWLSGYRVYYFPETYIFHKLGHTSKKIESTFVNYHSIKNRIASLIKNLNGVNLFLILVPHLILINLLGIYYLFTFQFKKFRMIAKSLYWNIKNLKHTLTKRKNIQKWRKISDSKLFELVGSPLSLKELFKHFLKVEKNYK